MREIIHTEPGEPGSWRPSLQEIHSEMRIDFERCQDAGTPVLFLHVGIEGLERIQAVRGDEGRELVLRGVTDLVRAKPREGTLYVYRFRGGLIVMVTGMPLTAGELFAQILVDEGRKLELPGDRGSLRLSLCIGLAATHEPDEHFFETMLCVAEEGAAVASAGGGGCSVHSQLYGLHQRRLEREMPGRLAAMKQRKEKRAKGAGARLAPLATPSGHAAHASAPVHATAPAAPAPAAAPRERLTPTVAPARLEQAVEALGAAPPVPLPSSVDYKSATESLHDRLRRLLRQGQAIAERDGAAAVADDLGDIEQHVFGLAERWGSEVLRKGLEAQATEHRMEMALLERRLEKLDRALAESEAELRRLATQAGIDYGVHSAYRTVQGLSAAEQQYELKHALMQQLLEANLELYAQISLHNSGLGAERR